MRKEKGESMEGISVAIGDTPEVGGMIAINESKRDDIWYVSKKYFEDNYSPAEEYEPAES